MTITSEVVSTGNLPGDGASFSFSFSPIKIFANSELRVYHTVTATGVQVLRSEGTGATDYSVSAIADFPDTGTITYPADSSTAIPSTETITITRVLVIDQQTVLKDQGGYLPSTHEDQYDKFVLISQQLQEQIDRCLKIPISDETIINTEVNTDALRQAGHQVQVSGDGTTFVTAGASSGTDATASNATPAAVSVSAGAAGAGTDFSREDHVHLLPTTVPRLATENIFTESQVWNKGSDVASTASMTLGAGNWFDITGTTTITGIVSIGIGTFIILEFDGILTITASSADLVCPGGEDIVTHAGMLVGAYEYASADWRLFVLSDGVPNRLRQSVDLSQKVTFSDDFIGVIHPAINSTAGSGAGTEVATISAGAGGRITLKSSSADAGHSANATILTLAALDWVSNQGGLTFEVLLQVDDISNLVFFIGFTDVISTTVELPVYKTLGADTLDSDATDACGVGFDTDGTTDEFWHGGVKAGTDTAATHSSSAPVNGTDVTIRVEVSSAGAVRGFINGTAIGAAVANAITTNTPLTPVIAVANRSASQRIMTVNAISAQANR